MHTGTRPLHIIPLIHQLPLATIKTCLRWSIRGCNPSIFFTGVIVIGKCCLLKRFWVSMKSYICVVTGINSFDLVHGLEMGSRLIVRWQMFDKRLQAQPSPSLLEYPPPPPSPFCGVKWAPRKLLWWKSGFKRCVVALRYAPLFLLHIATPFY